MITEKRLKWLQGNKQHGDTAAVVKLLNPKNSKYGISYSEAGSIINGLLWGRHGQAFTDALEKRIDLRLIAKASEEKKYEKIK